MRCRRWQPNSHEFWESGRQVIELENQVESDEEEMMGLKRRDEVVEVKLK